MIIPGGDVELLQDATLDYGDAQGLVIRNPNRPAPPMVEGLVHDDDLSAEIEAMVAGEVNPALAAHGGFVTYVGHDGQGTVYMTMGGGCHGCSMSKMTMLDGVQTMLVEAIPAVERVQGSHRPHDRREPVLLLIGHPELRSQRCVSVDADGEHHVHDRAARARRRFRSRRPVRGSLRRT